MKKLGLKTAEEKRVKHTKEPKDVAGIKVAMKQIVTTKVVPLKKITTPKVVIPEKKIMTPRIMSSRLAKPATSTF